MKKKSIDELLEYLRNEKEIIDHFNTLYESEARNSGFKSPKMHNKALKRIDERQKEALAICRANFKGEEEPETTPRVKVSKPKKDNFFKILWNKLFHKKTSVALIEPPEHQSLPPENDEDKLEEQDSKNSNIDTTGDVVETTDEQEEDSDADETFEDEGLEDDVTTNASAEDNIDNLDTQEKNNETT